ncbi:MAG: hypothetical protein L0387_02725 [Acidobacteria bacterium]|nr:hypothetical protein [Acidobacteriota bacterium]MCI0720027.1 hypothetical protein [Acidobacteriota bacterium]
MGIRVLAALVLVLAAGYLTLRALAGERPSLQSLELWSLAFGGGTGVLSLGMFYLAYCGILLSSLNVLIFAAGLLAVLAILQVLKFRSRRMRQVSRPVLQFTRKAAQPNHPFSPVEWVTLAVVGFCFLIVFADACSQPLLSFDARAIWAFKAKVLYFEQGIYNEAFLDAERLHAKTRYPQLIPLAETFIARVSGSFNERAFKLLFPCYFVSLVLLVGWELRREFSRRHALLATSFFAALPVFTIYANGGGASGYADLPLAFYCTALTTRLFRWLQDGSACALRVAVLLACLTAFTKTEGLALVFVTFSVTAFAGLFLFGRSLRSLRPLIAAVSAALICLTPWFIYKAQLPIVDEDFVRLLTPEKIASGLDRLPYILRSLGKEFFLKPHLWSLLWISAVALLLRSPKNTIRFSLVVFLWIPIFYTVLLCVIFMVIPWRLEELFPVALTRLMMHVAPLLFLWICFEVANSGVLFGITKFSDDSIRPGEG